MSSPKCITVGGSLQPLMTSAKQPARECCCTPPTCKKVTAYKAKVGFTGYLGTGCFLTANWGDENGAPAPWTASVTLDYKTGLGTGTWPSGSFSVDRSTPAPLGWPPSGCDGGGTNTHCRNDADQDYGDLSDEYTDEMLSSHVDDLLAGCDISSVSDGGISSATYDSEGAVTCSSGSGSCDFTAFYYKAEDGSWATKGKFSFVAWSDSYCLVETPDGGSPTYTTVSCTPGSTITIDPPSAPGTVIVQPECL